jgi:hypothetical protein
MSLPHRFIQTCLVLMQLLFMFIAVTTVWAAELKQRQVICDVEIVFSDPYAEKVQQYWDTLQNAGRRAGTHHLVVWLFDKASKKPIANAEVTVNLAETRFAGSEKGPFLTTVEEIPAYSGYFAMKAGIRYRNPGAC